MPAVDLDEEFVADPDDLKVPENPEHRRIIELIAVAAEWLVPDVAIYRDMNWYPLDGGNAIAPDAFTLPPGTMARRAKSYKQRSGEPLPGVAIEVVSDSDSYSKFMAKLDRYQRLGVCVYVINCELGGVGVRRLASGESDYTRWTGRPVSELGGLRIDCRDDLIVVTLPDGSTYESVKDFVSQVELEAAEAKAEVETLKAQLRSLGVEPKEDSKISSAAVS